MNLKTPGVVGYDCDRYCPMCEKRTIHYIMQGEGCKAYFCRESDNHRLAVNTLPRFNHTLRTHAR